ncbi:MAG: discoidin domain-containing protein [Opitutaceae bacterium]|jgi:hypothetical protein
MKPTLLLFLALLGATVTAQSQPFTQPASATNAPAGAGLIAANAAVANGILTLSLKSNGGDFTAWTHVFIDLGPAAKPSYNHTSGKPAGNGLEILLEGAQAYRFTGDTPYVWSWAPLSGVTVERTITGDTLTLKTPLAPLGLPSGGTVKIFAATYTENYADTLDTIPRDTRSWTFAVPKYNAPLPGKTTSAVTPLPARSDARSAFKKIQSYSCFYGPGRTPDLVTRDAAIIETRAQSVAEVNALRAAGRLAIGYISIGEDSELRTGDTKGPGGYDSTYFDRNGDNLPDKNETWNSYFANAASPAWRTHFLARADEIIKTHGVDGFFLDTIETSLSYRDSFPAMVSLIHELRARHPSAVIVMNRGWDLLPDLGATPDGIMFESFTLSYDFAEKRYVTMRPSAWDQGLAIWQKLIHPAQQKYGLVALALDYAPSADSPEIALAYDRAATLGMIPCVTSIMLDSFYDIAYQGRPDARWFSPAETADTRIVTMDTERNGFPAGTRVTPSSNYADYTVAAVVDGVTDKTSLGWRDRAWASTESRDEHSLEFTLPAASSASGVTIDWARDNGRAFPARSFRVEVRPAGPDATAWTRVDQVKDNTSERSLITFDPADITGLRIVQASSGGASARPNLMWVEQVSLVR